MLFDKLWTPLAQGMDYEAQCNGPCRCDQGCEIPLQFKRSSLAVFAHIRMVNVADDHGHPGQVLDPISCPLTSIGEDDERW